MKAMMLTAGLGTRLRPVTEVFAKPAVPFLNIPLFYYPLPLLEEFLISTLVLNTHYKGEQIARLSRKIPDARFRVELSPEPEAPLGSGGGIWQARKFLEGEGSFVVCNGDEVILPRDPSIMQRFRAEHEKHRALATILVMEHPGVGSQFGGVWARPDGQVLGFGRDASRFPGTHGYHYIGILLLDERIFSYLPAGESNILYDALATAIARGETVRIVSGDFTWFETGDPRHFLAATGEAIRLLAAPQKGADAKALEQIQQRFRSSGSTVSAHDSALILRESDTHIDSKVRLSGFVVLGKGARIEAPAGSDPNPEIRNVVLLPGATLNTSCADQIVIGPGSSSASDSDTAS